jgi:hypothetical protein
MMDTMTEPPSLDAVAAMWANVMEEVGEAALVLLPTPFGVAAAAFQPTDDLPILAAVTGIVEGLHPALVRPCHWAALAAPGFSGVVPDDEPLLVHGDLQKRYEAGDESVREVLTVLTVTRDEGARVRMQTYVQPHLSAEGDEGFAADDGPMAFALRAALLVANMDPIG